MCVHLGGAALKLYFVLLVHTYAHQILQVLDKCCTILTIAKIFGTLIGSHWTNSFKGLRL